MILTEKKPIEEIKESLKNNKKVFILGCGTCAALAQTGGEEQVKEMAQLLSDKEIVGTAVVETPCDKRLLKRDLRAISTALNAADAVLVLSCGVGIQTLVDLTGKIVIPGLNTKFIGMTEHIGEFYQRCLACSDCILDETGGICPISRCPKGLLNGPCAGHMDEKCEVDREKDCAWVLIYKRMKDIGKLDKFREFRKPRNYQISTAPQQVVGSGSE
ncbi:MAG: methylenetetrahydrofolate reductase C-terminal domain-containing protein [Candidatus Bathyarchaeota archaeon]|nr:MAG: methylenetetrahydrofolate reductase C-terminal domain-containing protein [Candidatus Bathyarchaeota archaeon]